METLEKPDFEKSRIATFNISDVHTFTVNDEQSTRFNIALHNDAYGTYTIRGYAVV